MNERRRDPGVERLEREGFVVLQHAYGLRSQESRRLSTWTIAGDLALSQRSCTAIVGQLVYQGLLAWSATPSGLRITPLGIEYVERLAGRRQSVRFGPEAPRIVTALGC